MSVSNQLRRSGAVRRLYAALASVGVIALASFLVQTPLRAGSGAEAQVTGAVQEIVKAYNDNDYEKYFSMFADDITIFRAARGRWTKREYHDTWKANVERGGGVASAAVDDLRVQMSPAEDASVTTFMMPVKSRFPGGVVPPGRKENIVYNMTEVWHLRQGKWIMVHMYWTVQDTEPAR